MRWRPKEPLNSYSHAVGALLAVAALVALVIESAGRPRQIVGFSIYGASLVLLYLASTAYHWLRVSPRGEEILRRLDHTAIFVLVAGTYTPVCLVTLRGGWGWSIFGVIWGLAVVGVALKLFSRAAPAWFTAAHALAMGWLALVAVVPLVRELPSGGLAWLLAGGLLYTAGAAVYSAKWPDPLPGLVGSHGVFHFFVLAASFSHFVFMARYVLHTA